MSREFQVGSAAECQPQQESELVIIASHQIKNNERAARLIARLSGLRERVLGPRLEKSQPDSSLAGEKRGGPVGTLRMVGNHAADASMLLDMLESLTDDLSRI